MSDMVVKKARKRRPAVLVKQTSVAVATADVLPRDAGLGRLHLACARLQRFARTCGHSYEEDALQALSEIGLLLRLLFRLEGDPGRVLRADGGKLDAALDSLLVKPRR